jgi:hypothetical protein
MFGLGPPTRSGLGGIPPDLMGAQTPEFKADALKKEILRIAAGADLDSEVVAMACADVLALIAATSDRLHGRQDLDDRLGALGERVRARYATLRHTMDTLPDLCPTPTS